jgi:LacI family transcriptional regulator
MLINRLKRRIGMDYSLNKIAKELGLSKTTVSLVLSGKARKNRISEEIVKKVKDFCAEVNYVPNIHAQRVNRKISGNIGFLIKRSIRVDLNDPFDD